MCVVEHRFTPKQRREFREEYLGGCEPCVINMLASMTIMTALSKVKEDDVKTQDKLEELSGLFGEGHISYRDLARATAELLPPKVAENIREMLQWAEALDLPTDMGIHGMDFESEEHEHPEWIEK